MGIILFKYDQFQGASEISGLSLAQSNAINQIHLVFHQSQLAFGISPAITVCPESRWGIGEELTVSYVPMGSYRVGLCRELSVREHYLRYGDCPRGGRAQLWEISFPAGDEENCMVAKSSLGKINLQVIIHLAELPK